MFDEKCRAGIAFQVRLALQGRMGVGLGFHRVDRYADETSGCRVDDRNRIGTPGRVCSGEDSVVVPGQTVDCRVRCKAHAAILSDGWETDCLR